MITIYIYNSNNKNNNKYKLFFIFILLPLSPFSSANWIEFPSCSQVLLLLVLVLVFELESCSVIQTVIVLRMTDIHSWDI
jgi:hypothetical protein